MAHHTAVLVDRPSTRPVRALVEGDTSAAARQFRDEVARRTQARFLPGELRTLPLAEYVIGDRFLSSVRRSGVRVPKLIDVTVEVLTGRAECLPGRGMHRIRTRTGGPVVRDDGAVAWRIAVEACRPSARRIHIWRTAGRVELIRVVLHDDFTP